MINDEFSKYVMQDIVEIGHWKTAEMQESQYGIIWLEVVQKAVSVMSPSLI